MLTGEPRVKPSAETARALAATIKSSAALPIAVGAGVINDLVKYAAELAGMPYVCVPTAASMDGYAASGAALRDDGFKRTFACAAPVAIVADLDVIATAPAVMAGWGYGDLVGKLVAGADWIVADALGVEALNPSPFAMVQNNLAAWLGEPAGVRRGERGALDGLMRGLIMAGLAMQAHGNSRPASGSDHQFAHLWEMEEVAVGGAPVSHGACVGIGCLSMLAAYEWLLRQDLSRIAPAELAARTPSAAALRAEVAASFPAVLHGRQRRGRGGGQGRRPAGRRDTPARACRRAGRGRRPASTEPARRGDRAALARGRGRAVERGGHRHFRHQARPGLQARPADPPPVHRPRRAARARLAGRGGERSVRRQWILESVPGGRLGTEFNEGRQHGQDKTGIRRRAARRRP